MTIQVHQIVGEGSQIEKVFPEQERKTIDFPYLVRLMKGQIRSPLAIATHPEHDFQKVLQTADNAFWNAIAKYRDEYTIAELADQMQVMQIDAKLHADISDTHYRRNCSAVGALGLVVGAIPGYMIGVKWENEYIERRKKEADSEKFAFRKAWLYGVHALEKQRKEKMIADIVTRLEVIETLIQRYAAEPKISLEQEKEQLLLVKNSAA